MAGKRTNVSSMLSPANAFLIIFISSSLTYSNFLCNPLYSHLHLHMKDKRYHINSVIISVVACVLVSALFGTVFAITLPSGICTIEIPAWSFILY